MKAHVFIRLSGVGTLARFAGVQSNAGFETAEMATCCADEDSISSVCRSWPKEYSERLQ